MLSASHQLRHVGRRVVFRRGLVTASRRAAPSASSALACWMAAGAAVLSVTTFSITSLDASIIMPPPIEEKATGILFPANENALSFVGCGVRVKYGFIKARTLLQHLCYQMLL